MNYCENCEKLIGRESTYFRCMDCSRGDQFYCSQCVLAGIHLGHQLVILAGRPTGYPLLLKIESSERLATVTQNLNVVIDEMYNYSNMTNEIEYDLQNGNLDYDLIDYAENDYHVADEIENIQNRKLNELYERLLKDSDDPNDDRPVRDVTPNEVVLGKQLALNSKEEVRCDSPVDFGMFREAVGLPASQDRRNPVGRIGSEVCQVNPKQSLQKTDNFQVDVTAKSERSSIEQFMESIRKAFLEETALDKRANDDDNDDDDRKSKEELEQFLKDEAAVAAELREMEQLAEQVASLDEYDEDEDDSDEKLAEEEKVLLEKTSNEDEQNLIDMKDMIKLTTNKSDNLLRKIIASCNNDLLEAVMAYFSLVDGSEFYC